MKTATADLSGAYPNTQVAESLFGNFGFVRSFYGLVVTVKVYEDNAIVRELLQESGEGRVLVIDGGGSMRCASTGSRMV